MSKENKRECNHQYKLEGDKLICIHCEHEAKISPPAPKEPVTAEDMGNDMAPAAETPEVEVMEGHEGPGYRDYELEPVEEAPEADDTEQGAQAPAAPEAPEPPKGDDESGAADIVPALTVRLRARFAHKGLLEFLEHAKPFNNYNLKGGIEEICVDFITAVLHMVLLLNLNVTTVLNRAITRFYDQTRKENDELRLDLKRVIVQTGKDETEKAAKAA